MLVPFRRALRNPQRTNLARLSSLAEASFKNVTVARVEKKRAIARKWQHRGGRFPHNAHGTRKPYTGRAKKSGLHPSMQP
jgi:hypothetical protein